MSDPRGPTGERLNELLASVGQEPVLESESRRFEAYCSLLIHWNDRINLTAIRGEDAILSRHFVESIACARALPVEIRTLLDFGSGAGFPGLPIAICRPEVAVTLAESQSKKAAFLREAARVLQLRIEVFSGRAETLSRTFDCVTLRAVDKMGEAIQLASELVTAGGTLALMTTEAQLSEQIAGLESQFSWRTSIAMPGGGSRILALGFCLGRKSRANAL